MKTQLLYDGKIEIALDEERHCYSLVGTGAKPDGVTTILGLIPKYLLPWVAKVTVEYITKGFRDRLEAGDAIDLTFLASLCDEAKREHTKKRDAAGDIGTLVHAWAEEYGKNGYAKLPAIDAPEYKGVCAVQDWLDSVEITDAEHERIIYHDKLFYAGTCDLFCKLDGKWSVVDFKTGSGFYADQPLQLAAYALAIEHEKPGLEIKDGWIIHIDKKTGKCTPYHVPLTQELKTDWEAVRIAWRAVKRNQERHKQIKADQKGS